MSAVAATLAVVQRHRWPRPPRAFGVLADRTYLHGLADLDRAAMRPRPLHVVLAARRMSPDTAA